MTNSLQKTVLFICTGNTCRSPMAEGYFNYLIKKENLGDHFMSVSAGTHAEEDLMAAESARKIAAKDGVNLANHRSRMVSRALIDASFLVLTMTLAHKKNLIERFPMAMDKIFTIKEYIGAPGDINDPIGYQDEVYENVFKEIKSGIKEVLQRLMTND